MHYPNTEEYQNNMVSQISGKISHVCKRLKPGVLSAIRERQVQGGLLVSAATNRLSTKQVSK